MAIFFKRILQQQQKSKKKKLKKKLYEILNSEKKRKNSKECRNKLLNITLVNNLLALKMLNCIDSRGEKK